MEYLEVEVDLMVTAVVLEHMEEEVVKAVALEYLEE